MMAKQAINRLMPINIRHWPLAPSSLSIMLNSDMRMLRLLQLRPVVIIRTNK